MVFVSGLFAWLHFRFNDDLGYEENWKKKRRKPVTFSTKLTRVHVTQGEVKSVIKLKVNSFRNKRKNKLFSLSGNKVGENQRINHKTDRRTSNLFVGSPSCYFSLLLVPLFLLLFRADVLSPGLTLWSALRIPEKDRIYFKKMSSLEMQ